MQPKQIIECVPNFSEGKNANTLAAISAAIKSITGVKLLHIDRGEAANRTVFTFAGEPQQVVDAAFEAMKVAGTLIDMRTQKGEHPRIGATDVCPLVPIANITMEEVKEYALQLGDKAAKELKIPIYLYEHSAKSTNRKNLATIRSGEYEGLAQKMKSPEWQPDFGKHFNPQTGATVLGARNFLIAYNANLDTNSVDIANQIARDIRESGKVVKNANGEKVRISGECKSLKAIGWYIEEYGKAQVSMNLTNFNITGIHEAYEACKKTAKKYGATVTGSELIGLIPLTAILDAGHFYANKSGQLSTELTEKELIHIAVEELGLAELNPFNFEERIIEYLL